MLNVTLKFIPDELGIIVEITTRSYSITLEQEIFNFVVENSSDMIFCSIKKAVIFADIYMAGIPFHRISFGTAWYVCKITAFEIVFKGAGFPTKWDWRPQCY